MKYSDQIMPMPIPMNIKTVWDCFGRKWTRTNHDSLLWQHPYLSDVNISARKLINDYGPVTDSDPYGV